MAIAPRPGAVDRAYIVESPLLLRVVLNECLACPAADGTCWRKSKPLEKCFRGLSEDSTRWPATQQDRGRPKIAVLRVLHARANTFIDSSQYLQSVETLHFVSPIRSFQT